MRSSLTLLLAVVAVAALAAPLAAQGGYDGILSVDSAKVHPSEAFTLNVWLRNNDLAVSAITVPLRYSGSALILDSVSLSGTVWGTDFSAYTMIDNPAGTVRITVLPNGADYPLPTAVFTNGVVAKMHFRVAAAAAPQRVEIDSIYVDSLLGGDIHLYTRIDISDNSGTRVYQPGFVAGDVEILAPTGVDDDPDGSALPTDFVLGQNYPNPFNPTTTISYSLPRAGAVKLEVFNVLGQKVSTLFEGYREAGLFAAEFDGSKQPSGIYFYRLTHDAGVETRKMMLLK